MTSRSTFDMGSNSRQHAHHTTLKSRLRRCVAGVAIGLLVASPAATTLAVDLEVPDPVAAAAAEASGWPDFDPSDMSQEIAITEAQQEAAAWPNYDSTALADPSNQIVIASANPTLSPIAGSEAEVALSSAEVASGSPRLTQIAASQAQADEEGAPVAAGPNTSTF